MVEYLTTNQVVAGSNPVMVEFFFADFETFYYNVTQRSGDLLWTLNRAIHR